LAHEPGDLVAANRVTFPVEKPPHLAHPVNTVDGRMQALDDRRQLTITERAGGRLAAFAAQYPDAVRNPQTSWALSTRQIPSTPKRSLCSSM
jgi:hypothetical protein